MGRPLPGYDVALVGPDGVPGEEGELCLPLANRPVGLMLGYLDDPQKKLPPVIHVAGTNGKGSTCAMLEAILRAAGYRVGLYTSPHLVRYNERVRIGGRDAGLTRMEYQLLHALAGAGGETLTRDDIHMRAWGVPLRAGSRSVDVLVRRLRRKVDERGGAYTFVQTVPGEGYRLQALARTLSA